MLDMAHIVEQKLEEAKILVFARKAFFQELFLDVVLQLTLQALADMIKEGQNFCFTVFPLRQLSVFEFRQGKGLGRLVIFFHWGVGEVVIGPECRMIGDVPESGITTPLTIGAGIYCIFEHVQGRAKLLAYQRR